MPRAPGQQMLTVTSSPPTAGMTRRGVVGRLLTTSAGTALAAAGQQGFAVAQDATPMAAGTESTLETETGQALYTLPNDHRWHGAPPNQGQFELALAELEKGLEQWQN